MGTLITIKYHIRICKNARNYAWVSNYFYAAVLKSRFRLSVAPRPTKKRNRNKFASEFHQLSLARRLCHPTRIEVKKNLRLRLFFAKTFAGNSSFSSRLFYRGRKKCQELLEGYVCNRVLPILFSAAVKALSSHHRVSLFLPLLRRGSIFSLILDLARRRGEDRSNYCGLRNNL